MNNINLEYKLLQTGFSNIILSKEADPFILEMFQQYFNRNSEDLIAILLLGRFSSGTHIEIENISASINRILTQGKILLSFSVSNVHAMIIGVNRSGPSTIMTEELSVGLQPYKALQPGLKAALSKTGELSDVIRLYMDALVILDHSEQASTLISDHITFRPRSLQDNHESMMSMERAFSSYLLQYDFKRACIVFNEIMNFLIYETYMPLNLAQETAHMRLSQTLRSLLSAKTVHFEKTRTTYISWLDKIFESLTFSELRRNIDAIFSQLEAEGTDREERSMREQIQSYIGEHYMDHNLCSSQICDIFHCSPSFLSKLFKNEIGCGFVGYVHSVRINAAKELMLHTDLSISEISAKVGFSSRKTFCRAFNNVLGIPPTHYVR